MLLDLPHVAVTGLVMVAVLTLAATVLRGLGTSWRRSTVQHELGLCRAHVAAGQFDDARDAYRRAERAHRPTMALDDTDTNLLALGPMSLLEPQPAPPLLARVDPGSLVITRAMRAVVADRT